MTRKLLACIAVVVVLSAGITGEVSQPARPRTSTPPDGHVISGRVLDPLGMQPEAATLGLGRQDGEGFSSVPVHMEADGSFVTPPVPSGTYVLQVVRTPHSATRAATVVAFQIVRVTTADVTGVTVEIQRDTAVHGRFRMESDNPAAPWPPHIVVNAFLALDGAPLLAGTIADGAPGGRFVLRNAFGPRVVRVGYTPAPGNPWWPSRVLLDGQDITNVPTDFSAHPDGDLEVVFTQHPARVGGTVVTKDGRPVAYAWVVIISAERHLWQQWATTSRAQQADMNGTFRFSLLSGEYLARAFSATAFTSQHEALQHLADVETNAVAVTLGERETKTLALTLTEDAERPGTSHRRETFRRGAQ